MAVAVLFLHVADLIFFIHFPCVFWPVNFVFIWDLTLSSQDQSACACVQNFVVIHWLVCAYKLEERISDGDVSCGCHYCSNISFNTVQSDAFSSCYSVIKDVDWKRLWTRHQYWPPEWLMTRVMAFSQIAGVSIGLIHRGPQICCNTCLFNFQYQYLGAPVATYSWFLVHSKLLLLSDLIGVVSEWINTQFMKTTFNIGLDVSVPYDWCEIEVDTSVDLYLCVEARLVSWRVRWVYSFKAAAHQDTNETVDCTENLPSAAHPQEST